MGAALTMHCGYRFCPEIAGMFALSGFLSKNSSVFKVSSYIISLTTKIPYSAECYY